MLAEGRGQAPQVTATVHAGQPRAVPVQRLRQQRQRPQPRAWQGRCAAASSSTGSDSSAAVAEAPVDVPQRQDSVQHSQGKRVTEAPDCDAAQLLLGMGLPTSGAGELQKAIAKLHVVRQHGVVQHSSQVAAHLRSLGVGQQQLVRLVQCCPELFSWPAEERAAVLFGQLQQLGLTAPQAGECFKQQPAAAAASSFQPAIVVLAALYGAAGSKSSESGERQLGGLLVRRPSAVKLLTLKTNTLQGRIANLRRLGLRGAQVVAGLGLSWKLLDMSPGHLGKRQQLLQQELGVGSDLFAKILRLASRAVNSSDATLRQRCKALVAVFGKEAALDMVDCSTDLLTVSSAVWQAALEVMRLVGVADPGPVAQRHARVLTFNWLDPRRLVNRLALQRCLGLTPAAVYEQHAGYSAKTGTDRLVGRLLYLEQCGLLPLVEDKRARLQTWRREHGMPTDCEAPGEPALISLSDVCSMPDPAFLNLLSKNGCASDFAAFQAGLQCQPACQELSAAAEVEAVRLRAALPDELRGKLAAGAKRPAEDGEE